jgi:hypothetical protein
VIQKLFRRRRDDVAVAGVIDSMREMDVLIGRINLIVADEQVTVLIGRGRRAADLDKAFDDLGVDVKVAATFDPPVQV